VRVQAWQLAYTWVPGSAPDGPVPDRAGTGPARAPRAGTRRPSQRSATLVAMPARDRLPPARRRTDDPRKTQKTQ